MNQSSTIYVEILAVTLIWRILERTAKLKSRQYNWSCFVIIQTKLLQDGHSNTL